MAQYPLDMTDEEWEAAGRPTLLKSQFCELFKDLIVDIDKLLAQALEVGYPLPEPPKIWNDMLDKVNKTYETTKASKHRQ